MTTNKPDGGPAFTEECNGQIKEGMRLRDYFAAKALALKFALPGGSVDLNEMAALCYAVADAMIEARAKP